MLKWEINFLLPILYTCRIVNTDHIVLMMKSETSYFNSKLKSVTKPHFSSWHAQLGKAKHSTSPVLLLLAIFSLLAAIAQMAFHPLLPRHFFLPPCFMGIAFKLCRHAAAFEMAPKQESPAPSGHYPSYHKLPKHKSIYTDFSLAPTILWEERSLTP